MTHRGPNDRGTYQAPGVALGVRRLEHRRRRGRPPAVLERGRSRLGGAERRALQPRRDPRGARRAGHRFESRCDTEILPHLYERRRVDEFAQRLRGKFGLAVWDGRRRRAVLARDRLGIKPLYYAHVRRRRGVRLRAQEPARKRARRGRARLRGDRRVPHIRVLPGPRTPLAGVTKLMPGHRLVDRRRRRARGAVLALSAAPAPDSTLTPDGVRGAAARGARGVRPAAPDERRAARRDAQRRARLEPDRRADGAAHERAR